MSTPRPLAESFSKHGHTYRQRIRKGFVAIFEVLMGTRLLGFEVVQIRIAPEAKLPGGKTAPVREVYPSDEEFGRKGWYFMKNQETDAVNRFDSLTHGQAV